VIGIGLVVVDGVALAPKSGGVFLDDVVVVAMIELFHGLVKELVDVVT
jgi:hypothetical protein